MAAKKRRSTKRKAKKPIYRANNKLSITADNGKLKIFQGGKHLAELHVVFRVDDLDDSVQTDID